MQENPARTEQMLDHGWDVIGQLHQWLSNWPLESVDRRELPELIRGVQRLWTASDDFGLHRLARTCLAVEQFLERLYARKVVFTSEVLADISAGIAGLQDLLLGFEATREEPPFSDPAALQRLEQRVFDGYSLIEEKPENSVLCPDNRSIIKFQQPSSIPSAPEQIVEIVSTETQTPNPTPVEQRIENATITMLEQFVNKLEETCEQLHKRICHDQAPYAATSSRLEHLVRTTRQLVEKLTNQLRGTTRTELTPAAMEGLFHPQEGAVAIVSAMSDFDGSQMSVETIVEPEQHSTISESTAPLELVAIEPDVSVVDFVPTAIEPAEPISEPMNYRVLIAEESLFYCHLIGIAVRTSGYECETVEPAQDLETMIMSDQYDAILISSSLSMHVSDLLLEARSSLGMVVVALMESDLDEPSRNVDAKVVKSHPGEIIKVLNQLLISQTDNRHKIAG